MISNVNIDRINKQVNELISEINIKDNLIKLKAGCEFENILQDKYSYLYSISKTLFSFIIKEHKKDKFNRDDFKKNLNITLSYITKIQQNQITQDKASEHIGTIMAKQYIPSHLLK